MPMNWLLVDWKLDPKYPLLVLYQGAWTNAAPNSIEGPCSVRWILKTVVLTEEGSRQQGFRCSCSWLCASVSQENGTWYLNTRDSLRQSLSLGQNRGVWKEQDLFLHSKKCNNLNTAGHYCLQLARAGPKKTKSHHIKSVTRLWKNHSPSSYFVSIFPYNLLQFLHNSKDIWHIQVHI